jgi:pyridoxal phosphate enzyme (YggS family)
MTALPEIRSRIDTACKKAGRGPSCVKLVAASKSQPMERIKKLLDQGQRIFGENKVQEAEEKFVPLRAQYPDLELHFIGNLQTNKVKDAVRIFDVIETVDRPRLAEELHREMVKQNRFPKCYIQVNTGHEEQKGGVIPADLGNLFKYCRDTIKLPIEGLMCVPPLHEIPDLHFALLHKLAGELGLPKISMGMSADFETAIRYGASHIRVGSALFGQRQNSDISTV